MVHIRRTTLPWIMAFGLAIQSQAAVGGECTPQTPSFCLDGVTPVDSLRVTTGANLRAVREHVYDDEQDQSGPLSLRFEGLSRQVSAGKGYSSPEAWDGWGFSQFDSGLHIAPYETDPYHVSAGFDTNLSKALAAGLMVGFEDRSTDSDFDGVGGNATGWTLAPYAAWLINDWLSLDSSFAYSWLNYDQDRVDQQAGRRMTADFDAERWQLAVNLNASWEIPNWLISAQAGVLRAAEDQDPYNESGAVLAQRSVDRHKVLLTQGQLGIKAAHLGSKYEPFLGLTYRNDLSRTVGRGADGLAYTSGATVSDDDDEFEARLGVRVFEPSGFSLSAELAKVFNREDFDSTSILFTLRSDL